MKFEIQTGNFRGTKEGYKKYEDREGGPDEKSAVRIPQLQVC
jgi:hypothetical protein